MKAGSRIRIKRYDRSELRSDLIKRNLFETRLVSHDCELCMSIKIPLRVHASPKYHAPGATEVKLKYKEGLSCGSTGNVPKRVGRYTGAPPGERVGRNTDLVADGRTSRWTHHSCAREAQHCRYCSLVISAVEGLGENFLTEGLTLKKAFFVAESRTSRWTHHSWARAALTADIS